MIYPMRGVVAAWNGVVTRPQFLGVAVTRGIRREPRAAAAGLAEPAPSPAIGLGLPQEHVPVGPYRYTRPADGSGLPESGPAATCYVAAPPGSAASG